MGKTSSKVKDRYNAKAYDEIKVRVPKGRKAEVDARVRADGGSVNGLINRLLREYLGQSEAEWSKRASE